MVVSATMPACPKFAAGRRRDLFIFIMGCAAGGSAATCNSSRQTEAIKMRRSKWSICATQYGVVLFLKSWP
jgi:hypothetical protein